MNNTCRIGIGGPVGSGKTALIEAITPRLLEMGYKVLIITNDIVTTEDAKHVRKTLKGVLVEDRIIGVETGACPHTAVREDPSMNIAAVEEMEARFPDGDVVLIESGGDNLTLTFSPALVDFFIYVIDVAAGACPHTAVREDPSMNIAAAKEMAPYLAEPTAMPVGSPGKTGYLRLGFELDDEGRSILRDLERRTPLIVQQELYFDEGMPEMPCVYILSSGGPNVDGDRYEQRFTVREGAFAHVSTGAATKLAEMRCNCSGLRQHFELEAGAYLEYLPEPTIPCRHTRFIADTTIRIDPTATLFYAEIYMSGRKYYDRGEKFAYDILSVTTRAARPDGERLFREKFVIRPGRRSPETLGVMNGYDVFANAIVLTPPAEAERIYDRTEAFVDDRRRLAAGITRLPNGCGVLYKALGAETDPVKRLVRSFCATVREEVKRRPMPDEFPWR